MNQEIKELTEVVGDERSKRLWGLADPETPNVLIAIIVVLLIHAGANLFSSLSSLKGQNFQGFFVYLVIAAIYAVPAYGLLKLNRWARILQLVSSLFMVITGFISVFGGNRLVGAVAIVMHGMIAMYLLTEKCQLLFKSQSSKSDYK